MEGVAIPIPFVEQLCRLALILGPGIAICKRSVHGENGDGRGQEDDSSSLSNDRALSKAKTGEAVRYEIVDLAKTHDGKVQSREVVMQEELTLHQVEREVVEEPAKQRHSNLVVEALERDIAVVLEATLPTNHSEALDSEVCNNRESRRPPNKGVTDEVDLAVVLTPEVDTTLEEGPRWRA